jgi:hypothetical protein
LNIAVCRRIVTSFRLLGQTKHDRDVNAAVNIKEFILQDQNPVGILGYDTCGVRGRARGLFSKEKGMNQETPPSKT